MQLDQYVDSLRSQLAVAASAGGDEARELAGRLSAALDPAVRLVLLDALSAAAGAITLELAPGSVDVRLRGTEPTFVVTTPVAHDEHPSPEPAARATAESDDAAMTRINLRLSEELKSQVEDAARTAGLSVNAWLVRAASAALDAPPGHRHRTGFTAQRVTGWVR